MPNKKPSILDTLGGKSTKGVVGRQFLWKFPWASGSYSFSLQNRLKQPVKDILCLVIFYDIDGEPIDVNLVRSEKETIPAGLAKRVESYVDGSVQALTTHNRSTKPHTKVEFRILDFRIAESDNFSEETSTPSLSSEFLRSHVKKLLMNLYSHNFLGLNYYSRTPSAEPYSKQAGQQKEHEPDPLRGQVKVAQRPVFGISLGEHVGSIQGRFKISKRHLLGQDNAYYELWYVQHDSEVVDKCTVQTFLNRILLISIFFKDSSERNFKLLKEQIEKTYEVQGHKPYMELAWEYSANLDGIPIFIYVMPKIESFRPTPLSVTYVHWPFMGKSCSLIDQYSAGIISNDL